MAVIRKKESRTFPNISTASLPDIIFMLLFFFMITTTMRDRDILVRQSLPLGSQVQKLEKKSLTSYIYIGAPASHLRDEHGAGVVIQLNDSFHQIADIGAFIESERSQIPEAQRDEMVVSIKADRGVRMDVITDVKTELRRAGVTKVSYGANKPLE